jgi:hypothetical protein
VLETNLPRLGEGVSEFLRLDRLHSDHALLGNDFVATWRKTEWLRKEREDQHCAVPPTDFQQTS